MDVNTKGLSPNLLIFNLVFSHFVFLCQKSEKVSFGVFVDTKIRVIYLTHKYLTCVLCLFTKREQGKITTAAGHGKILIYRIKSVIDKRFPDLFAKFDELTDYRTRI